MLSAPPGGILLAQGWLKYIQLQIVEKKWKMQNKVEGKGSPAHNSWVMGWVVDDWTIYQIPLQNKVNYS